MEMSSGRLVPEMPRRVAVVGSGISGLSTAWLLSKTCEVVLYETEDRLGGHAHTVDVPIKRGSISVDTGFIVYNDRNYPNLVALFEHLGVPNQPSDMSFAASVDDGGFEYSGTNLRGLLGQKINAARPRFWRMLSDILRFYKSAEFLLARRELETLTLGEYLVIGKYSPGFIQDHLLPMGAAIWSASVKDMRAYPLHAFLRFFVHHGLILLTGRPQWRTVTGGSREYVRRLEADFKGSARLNTAVTSIERDENGVTVIDSGGNSDRFTDIVISSHADDALRMLVDADDLERAILGEFHYTPNTAVLHADTRLMPKRRSVWSSWNYIGGKRIADDQPLCVTYWMNHLQGLDPEHSMFLTLNPCREIRSDKIFGTYNYSHPLFDHDALAAQKQLWSLQGRRNTWFCGAYFGSGFHEDGLQSGLAVAEELGNVRRPWSVPDESGRIFLTPVLEAAE